jgi:prevent-host-death family protein
MAVPRQRTTETMSVSEARKNFSGTLDRVRESDVRIVVEKSGIPVAAVVPISVLQDDEDRERQRQEALRSLKEVQAGFVGVSEEEAEREIAKALDEIKEERRVARRIARALIQADPQLFTSSEESITTEVARLLKQEEARALAERRARNGREE